jgi:hypothetical protein
MVVAVVALHRNKSQSLGKLVVWMQEGSHRLLNR